MKDPLVIIKQCKTIYLKKGEKHHGYSDEELSVIYTIGVRMLKKLKFFRDSQNKTAQYLRVKARINEYKCDVTLLELWLLQSLQNDDTYVYAYNYLAQKANRAEMSDINNIKLISDLDLMDLLSAEIGYNNSHFQADPSDNDCKKDERDDDKKNHKIRINSVEEILEILKDFVIIAHHSELENLLKEGINAQGKLFFQSTGNRLTDMFKKLIEHDFILGIDKSELERWIVANFTYLLYGKEVEYKIRTVQKYISRKGTPCKSPIIEIVNGTIERPYVPKIRKDNNL